MSILAIYDVLKIQEFIFASNKLAENLGASIFVQQVFEKQLIEAIENTVPAEARRRTKWKEQTAFEIALSNSQIQAEVVYIGGGNAMAAYADKNIAIKVTQKLSHILLEATGGALQFAVAYLDTDCQDYQADKDALFKRLNANKAQRISSSPLMGIGITRPGNDGLPAIFPEHDENSKPVYLSKVAKLKLMTDKHEREYFDKLLPANTQDFAFPREFDKLGQEKGDENYIAIVHIDGNNQGAMFDKLVKDIQDYQEAVKRIRKASSQIANTYENVMKTLVASVIEWGKKHEFEHFTRKEGKYQLPIRPIVLNGDDVTFVSYGKFGVPFAEIFLKALEQHSPLKITESKKMPLSACAGVAIVKSHFPFYRAYTLAEELCKSAKTKAKILAKNHDHDEIGSWLDFHIVQSGVTTNLPELRKRFYLIPTIDKNWTTPDEGPGPDALKEPKHANHPDMKYEQYHLLWRPWRIVGTCEECGKLYDWNELVRIWKAIHPEIKQPQGQTQWRNSRLKHLRNTMITSKEEINDMRKEFISRNIRLPEFLGDRMVFKKRPSDDSSFRQTPYFDAIEVLEYYKEIPTVKGGQTQ